MATTRDYSAKFAIDQAISDFKLSESNDNDADVTRKYTTADILGLYQPQPVPAKVENKELRRHSGVKSSNNHNNDASVRPRPGVLRRSSSMDTIQGKPARLRLSEKERVEALKRDDLKSRDNQKRRSLDIPRPLVGKDGIMDDFKEPKVEELTDDVYGSRGHNSLDIPRPLSKEVTTEEKTSKLKYDSIAAEFGLGPLDQEEMNEYTIWNASITNLRLCPVNLNGGKYFYIETRSFIPKRPGVTVHAGSDKSGRVIGVAHLDYFSTNNLLGVGDTVGNPTGVQWYKLHRNHGNVVEFFTHVKYTFEVTNGETEEKRKFEWYRTKNLPILDDQGDLALVEEGRTEVLAEYKGNGPIGQLTKQRGSLKIKKTEEFGKNWEMLVLLGWASIVEMSRRRARMRRSSVLRAGIF